ncbi:hypothetical protein AB4Z50_01655 [Paenibacillus sp. 2TAB26]|uniref:hypothetical protein n=1 Tax=Paenibacillus sp. 2TAB26 TaxID=3233005 RepID=UPI003F9A843B
MNYNWNSPDGWNNGDSTNQVYIKKSVEEAKRRGIDPLKTVFSGIEAGMGKNKLPNRLVKLTHIFNENLTLCGRVFPMLERFCGFKQLIFF